MQAARSNYLLLSIAGLILLPAAAWAREYVDESRTIVDPQSKTEHLEFAVTKEDPYPHLEITFQMSQGRADLTVIDPDGQTLLKVGAQDLEMKQPIPAATLPGTYIIELTTTNAVGTWRVGVRGGPSPPKKPILPGLVSGIAMLLVAMASVWIWRRWTDESWNWLWAGAGLWAVAVVAKFAIAIPLNQPILEGLKSSLPYGGYIAAGMIYGGALTGITEVLITFVAALIWPRMAATPQRAVAVGVGAGAFEAALLAIAAGAAAFVVTPGTTTWLVALAPAVERVIAILCHVASRVLAIMAVASRRWILFIYGFLLLSCVDAVAMYLHLSGSIQTMSPWLMEAMLVPFGVISIPIIRSCVGDWPTADPPLPELSPG